MSTNLPLYLKHLFEPHSSFTGPETMSLKKDCDLCQIQIAEPEETVAKARQIQASLRTEATRSSSSQRRERKPQQAPIAAVGQSDVTHL